MTLRPWLLVAALSSGCGEQETEPAPSETPEAPAPAPAQPPDPPPVESLDAPSPGRARAIVPAWDEARRWFGHQTRESPAKLGRSTDVTQALLGEEGADGILITFYGRDLEPGDYRVLPATDETRRDHAGRDSDVFTVVLTRPGEDDMRSESGTVRVESVDDALVGTLDVIARSRVRQITSPLRARFHALPDARMDFALEQEAQIRDQLRRRRP